jgi:plastocyanin
VVTVRSLAVSAPSHRSTRPFPGLAARALLAAGLLLVPVACGSDDEPAAKEDCRLVQVTAGKAATTVVAKNLQFDVTCLKMAPGTLTITYENQDSSVAHDLHVTGNGVNRRTELARGTTTQELVVELLRPGRYSFFCDPHATMEGTIEVVAPASATGASTSGS